MIIDDAVEFTASELNYVSTFKALWSATSFISEDRAATPAELAAAAEALRYALGTYGAGKRRAPKLAPLVAFVALLADDAVRRTCTRLRWQVLRWKDTVIGPVDHLEAIALLDVFAARGFVPATNNSLFPLKMLMMLTGLGPAPDRWVRMGLTARGYAGWTTASKLVPASADAPAAMRLLELWASMAAEIFVALGNATVENADIRWIVNHGALGRLADMAYFQIGKMKFADMPAKIPQQADKGGNMETMATWAGRAQFQQEPMPDGGYFLCFGVNGRAAVTGTQIADVLRHFAGRTIPVGTSRSAPPEGSLGQYLQLHVNSVALASYVAALLVRFHGAERVRENQSLIRFPA